MPIEIEHKYLVNREAWASVNSERSSVMKQAYMQSDPDKTIRVRIAGDKGFLTIKGKSRNASRAEYEYEIPRHEAEELITGFCSNVVEKVRHYVPFAGNIWEVDIFSGANAGLIVAEIELDHEHETYDKPHWVGENVTFDPRYSNASLARNPYSAW